MPLWDRVGVLRRRRPGAFVPGARTAFLTTAAFTALAFAVTARTLPPRRKALTETA
ncbi:hypothetical protein OH809_41860 [Streptomyces sp. NBC_00873]|uniref:hypothetical protein n=1 Tax=unclassified Streptomyces TaxID=2593676 RepID=UPI00386E4397|nr:hypothetical protein OH809_01850 [Streptomyces sp. NBC_00873]WSY96644.1 hypothetical protein OH809_41860 [Streptomyces sp. NBC_00873]WTA41582.1 hypothetical protein OH821_01845 [Streptomyces sp. NBC_00842]WTA48314.1 hypothetical protein OH821_41965 [Streptomyces sp. NBC_00842]